MCSQESARAKAQGAKIWGQGAGQGVLAQGKAKAKGGKSGKGVAKTGAAGKVGWRDGTWNATVSFKIGQFQLIQNPNPTTKKQVVSQKYGFPQKKSGT